MDCPEVDELAGAIALGALPPEEMARVREHLRSCRNHPHLAELQAVGQALLWTAPEVEPAPQLKARVLAAAAREERRPLRPWFPRWTTGRWAPLLGTYRLAAALALLALGLLGWNLYLQLSPGSEGPAIYAFAADGAHGRLVYFPDAKTAVMVVQGLPPAPPGMAYQVWAVRDGQHLSVGLLHVEGAEPVSAAMSMDLRGVRALAVTVEPEGGSPRPTSAPVLTLRF